ncbi:hypothetical protein Fleli_2555 [Bernardetia litoralis DSM 6794]|uniref:Uncharacterized protein n=1 Tax=Bernardetia litoralis (strain ATCC 23117 / DSM 6794 / NBRC 15988 / NCIMB 1366 / Fx l1 / Sio-4) TaxID=880071 RepID=I4ALT4_BERLS|nr:hypothetical protein Fleli_2555 [Bernardetia litoralis DSM 6794]
MKRKGQIQNCICKLKDILYCVLFIFRVESLFKTDFTVILRNYNSLLNSML